MTEQEISGEQVSIQALRDSLEMMYRPHGVRQGILADQRIGQRAQRVLEECIAAHGLLPARRLARMRPRPLEGDLRSEDLVDFLTRYGHEYQVVLLQAMRDRGPMLDIGAVMAAGHAAGCVVGWDLAGIDESDRRLFPLWNADFTF